MYGRIAIIGSGVSGLSAAQLLFNNGFKDVIILEAMPRIGGRVHTIAFDDNILELGAQWLHGELDNPAYHLAKQNDLLADTDSGVGVEGDGHFYTDLGDILQKSFIDDVISRLNIIKDKLSFESRSKYSQVSVADIYRQHFTQYVKSHKCWRNNNALLWPLFDWFMKFETIDNSCKSLSDISLLSYTEWRQCEGNSLVNFKNGYKTLLEIFLTDIPIDAIRLNTPVECIELSSGQSLPSVKLTLENKECLFVNHVIVTSSLGFIQKNMNSFFRFKLPDKKANIIKSLGFGAVNKIYLVFENPFWNRDDKGFQLIWTKHYRQFPDWVYHICGFDVVRGHSRVLCGWIGGTGAEEVDKVESDQLIALICAQVLQMFLKNINIELPKQVIRSKWSANKYICGSYSNRTIDYERGNYDIKDFQEPIAVPTDKCKLNKSINWPHVLFAGEATHKEYYSTTHGALLSGRREANRLIEFYDRLNNELIDSAS